MRHAVFFRNVNLGRANCPTRAQLEAAFLAAGASTAASFLVNGTLVWDTPSGIRPRALLAGACARLRDECGLREPAFVRTMSSLARLVARDAFAAVGHRADVHERVVTFLADDVEPPALPLHSPRGDVSLLDAVEGAVFGLSLVKGKSFGSPNAFLERTLGRPATSRNWNTVTRLVARFG